MSTQNSGHAPTHFSVTTPFRSVRLLEVPDDLLDIITSTSKSSTTTNPRLKFKSAPPQRNLERDLNSTKREGVLHLCADGSDKAWAVKQVSTSNSVYLIEPTKIAITSQSSSANDDDNNLRDTMQDAMAGAVTAVAQVSNFLELHPVKINDRSVEKAILDTIPVYHPLLEEEKEQMDIDLDRHTDFEVMNRAKTLTTWEEAVNNIAAPDDVVHRVGRRLGIFEDVKGNCMIPSTRAVLDVWSKIVEGCAIEGIKLDHELSIVRLLNILIDDTESSLAEKMLNISGMFDQLGLFHHNDDDDNTTKAGSKLNPTETCHFIAGLILSSSHPRHLMSVDTFITKWTDLVPASFVKHCTIESLTAPPTTYEVTTSEDGSQAIKWTNPTPTQGPILVSALSVKPADLESTPGVVSSSITEAAATATSKSTAADKKRKWHEKFGAQRNLKK